MPCTLHGVEVLSSVNFVAEPFFRQLHGIVMQSRHRRAVHAEHRASVLRSSDNPRLPHPMQHGRWGSFPTTTKRTWCTAGRCSHRIRRSCCRRIPRSRSRSPSNAPTRASVWPFLRRRFAIGPMPPKFTYCTQSASSCTVPLPTLPEMIRFGSQLLAEVHEFMRAKTVVLGDTAPPGVHDRRTVLLRADAVLPVIRIREASSRPPEVGDVQTPEGLNDVVPDAARVRHGRVLVADIVPAVDATPEMLGEMSVDVAADRVLARSLHSDACRVCCEDRRGQNEACGHGKRYDRVAEGRHGGTRVGG